MRFLAGVASLLVLATTTLADPWKNLGGDLALIGPSYNATFKAGDTIPLEYTFFTLKMVNANGTLPANNTAPPTGTATLTSLTWVGKTGNKTLEVTLNNERQGGPAVVCQKADVCSGSYYPKRVDLVIPPGSYAGNYTILIGYTLSLAGNRTMPYRQPINVVAASANVTSPTALVPDAPSVRVELPVYEAPKSSGLTTQVPKAVLGMAVALASGMMMFL
ncbi:hypothetical protein BGW38_002487 [Lunasporangiospora selenospora]|uniref:Uncharacterized protein n=1 Tax=Lunasporangiospora selenospora TaxID=979761 RepID=A0A9P6FS05_9FUNG|nr:hypothetical protein BGW38_002487 [Lunasporangiospora selenospora]